MNFDEHLKKYLTDEEIKSLDESLDKDDFHALLLNTEKISEEDFLKEYPLLKKHPVVKNGFYYDKDVYPFGKSYLHDAGCYYLQEPSAMIVSSLLKPTKNDIVLDMCAAPGGKTIQASLLMENKGVIFSNDLSYSRAKILSSNVERMGRKNIIVTSMDLHNFPASYLGKFTKIILDAPCSGSGMFRKDESVKEDWTYEKVLKYAAIQKELISLAHDFLAPGGTLVYSTCSFSYEEDEEVIDYALNTFNDFILDEEVSTSYPFFKSINNKGFHLLPSLFDGEGHYICLLHKKGTLPSITLPSSKIKNIKFDYKSIFEKYELKGSYPYFVNESLYALPCSLSLDKMTVLRPGIKVCDFIKDNIIPDHGLAHYVSTKHSIQLNEQYKDVYLHGDTFTTDLLVPNGFYVVSYHKINLGFVKYVKGTLKNHYPKGLRH